MAQKKVVAGLPNSAGERKVVKPTGVTRAAATLSQILGNFAPDAPVHEPGHPFKNRASSLYVGSVEQARA